MPALITELIDKRDNSELIGDLLASILAVELANQQALATTAGKDPSLWKVRVFKDRANPWDEWSELSDDDANRVRDPSPLVNVAFDSATYDKSSSDAIQRQKCVGLFNLDVYGYGESQETFTGHRPGDLDAAEALERAVRLVRNILMSAQYAYLGLPRKEQQFVWSRWPNSVTFFQPAIDGMTVPKVLAARLVLAVEFNEFAPQVIGQPIELIAATVKRKETGEVYVTAEYDLTA